MNIWWNGNGKGFIGHVFRSVITAVSVLWDLNISFSSSVHISFVRHEVDAGGEVVSPCWSLSDPVRTQLELISTKDSQWVCPRFVVKVRSVFDITFEDNAVEIGVVPVEPLSVVSWLSLGGIYSISSIRKEMTPVVLFGLSSDDWALLKNLKKGLIDEVVSDVVPSKILFLPVESSDIGTSTVVVKRSLVSCLIHHIALFASLEIFINRLGVGVEVGIYRPPMRITAWSSRREVSVGSNRVDQPSCMGDPRSLIAI